MRIYLDEDTAAGLLCKPLRAAGHDISDAITAGMTGESDAVQLADAIGQGRVFLTHNYEDFQDLHDLIAVARGAHRGVLVIRKDNDSARDLSPRGIVNAIRKLELAGAAIENQYLTLNHWR